MIYSLRIFHQLLLLYIDYFDTFRVKLLILRTSKTAAALYSNAHFQLPAAFSSPSKMAIAFNRRLCLWAHKAYFARLIGLTDEKRE